MKYLEEKKKMIYKILGKMNVGVKLVHKCSSSSVEANGGGDV